MFDSVRVRRLGFALKTDDLGSAVVNIGSLLSLVFELMRTQKKGLGAHSTLGAILTRCTFHSVGVDWRPSKYHIVGDNGNNESRSAVGQCHRSRLDSIRRCISRSSRDSEKTY